MTILDKVREDRLKLAEERAALLAEADKLAEDRDGFGTEQEARER